MSVWTTLKYFKQDEFNSPDEPGSGVNMHGIFLKMLDELRERVGEPLSVSSGYRTFRFNKTLIGKGAVEDSAHTKGFASDLECESGALRFKIIEKALAIGFLRIGVGETFIHLDCDPSKPQQVLWLY